VHLQSQLSLACNCISQLAQSRPPSPSRRSLNFCVQLHLQPGQITASKCISKLAETRPPSASPHRLYHGPQVHLWVHSILACKCISKLSRSRPRSVSLSSLDPGLEVNLSTRSITAFKYIITDRRRVYRDIGVTEVDWTTGSTYLAGPGVDWHPHISISSGSTRLRGFSLPGCIIASHFPPRLLELEPSIMLYYRLWPDWPYIYIEIIE